MPKGKSRGRKGGGRTAKARPADGDAVVESDLNSSSVSVDCELVEGNHSQNECSHLELAVDEVSITKTQMTVQTLECSPGLESSISEKERLSSEITKESVSKSELSGVNKFPEATDKENHLEEKLLNNSLPHDSDRIDNQDTNLLIIDQKETELLEIVDKDNNVYIEMHFGSDQNAGDNAPNIAMKVSEDQQHMNTTESPGNKITTAVSNELQQWKNTDETVNSTEDNVLHNSASADLIKQSIIVPQEAEELDNSKFEEISEGSIEQAEQDEINAEALSDVEITGHSSKPDQNISNVAGKMKELYKKSESLKAACCTSDNDKVQGAAENKDHDDISDASLSDHVDADLSLEEISDDELEPSKKKRKLGQTPENAGNGTKGGEPNKPNVDNAFSSDDKVQGDKINVKKNVASEDISEDSRSNKRIKLDEQNDIEEVSSKGEDEPALLTDVCDDSEKEKQQPPVKDVDTSHCRNNRNLSQSSKSRAHESTEKAHSFRDLASFSRRHEMVDASCQSEPRRLKGKIVQCNINPIKLSVGFDKKETYAANAATVFEKLNKFKLKPDSGLLNTVISDVCSLQPSPKKDLYSISMGPLLLSDTHSSAFKDVQSGTENFSLVFDSHCQGIFKATFSKVEDVAFLLAWLNQQKLNNDFLVLSVINSCNEEDSDVCVWQATLLLVNEESKQPECQVKADDEECEAKLYLEGVPKDVSKSFINLLFPEAQSVVTVADNRIITLDFSDKKIMERILSTYGLLVINGCHISMSCMKPLDKQQDVSLATDASNESDNIIKLDKENEDQTGNIGTVSTDLDQGSHDAQQKEIETSCSVIDKLESESSSKQQPSQVLQDANAGDLGEADEGIQGFVKEQAESEMLVCSGTVSGSAEQSHAAGTKCVSDDRTEATDGHDSDVNQSSIEKIAAESESKETGSEVEKATGNITSESVINSADVGEIIKDNTSSLDVAEVEKHAIKMQDETGNDVKALTNPDSTKLESGVDVANTNSESQDCKTSDKATSVVKTESSGKILENVSDKQAVNHGKHGDIQILINRSLKRVITNNELAGKPRANLINVALKELGKGSGKEEVSDKSCSNVQESDSAKVTALSDNDEKLDSKLVMTDGSLEVSMEVIDVNDGTSGEPEKVIYPSAWLRTDHRRSETGPYLGAYSSYASKSSMYAGQRDPYRHSPPGASMSGASKHQHYPTPWRGSPGDKEPFIESAEMRDSFPPKHRSCSRSPRRDVDFYTHRHSLDHHQTGSGEQWSRSYDSRPPGSYEDSRRAEYYSRHDSSGKPSGHHSHRDYDYKETRPPSLTKISVSPERKVPASHRSPYRRGSPSHPNLRTSRSPISISSRSHSLSPVSRSPSLDLPETGVEKDELAKTVEHILKLAKGLQQTKRRRPSRQKSSRLSSSRHSPHVSRSSYVKRSRSPQPALSRHSRSPTYTGSSRYKYKRSLSPVSPGADHKGHYGDYSSDRKGDPYPRESGSSRSYEREKSRQSAEYYEDQSSRSKSGKWLDTKYSEHHRSSSNQPWQQSHSGYQPQSCGPVPGGSIYNTSYPPPNCPPPVQYPGSSMPPVFPYNSQSQYNYSNIPTNVPPPFMPNIPPPPTSFPYQSTYSAYPPRF